MVEFLTCDEVAVRLRCDPATIRCWVRTRGLPATRIGAKLLRINPIELDAWLSAQQGPRPRAPRKAPSTITEQLPDERQVELESDPLLGQLLEAAQ